MLYLKLTLSVLVLCLLASGPCVLYGQVGWPHFGNDAGGMRFSPLSEITPRNVARLQVAWTFHSGSPGSETTPVVVGGVMYLTQPNGIFALVPETGELLWKYEAEGVAIRGLAYWPGDATTPPRVFAGVRDQLLAIDVRTGKPAAGFGEAGRVDLKAGVAGDLPDVRLSLNSPPAVYRNIIITGSSNGEGSPSTGAYGDIRGWDARSGALVWTFHTVPRDGETGSDTWPEGAWKNRSGVNTWGFLTVDTDRGMVFAPTGSPTSDFYGADRHGDGLFGNSLVALDASSGKLRWYQQLVHHDIWDYDVAAAPALFDIRREGKRIPAVAQITKMGLLFVFDRVTGEPVYGMEERPVPQSVVPGEATSPTQPFPLKPPPLARNTFREEEMYNLTAEHKAFCRDLFERNKMVISEPYTPFPVEENVLLFPSTLGGGNWGGVSVDPSLGYLFTNVMNVGQFGRMMKRTDGKEGVPAYVRKSEYGPYARFWNPETRVPCNQPPFGELVAVNLATGDIAWSVPLGSVAALEAQGVKDSGAVNLGGSIATAGGLVFIGATNDQRFRAFESKTGRLVWDHAIEANGHAIPISYKGRDGRQYVVIMAGGGGGTFGSPLGDSVTAFALGGAMPRTEMSATTSKRTDVGATRPVASGSGSTTTAAAASRVRSTPVARTETERKAFVEQSCAKQCHGMDVVTSRRRTKAEWTSMVHAMVARGAKGSAADIEMVIDYLSRNFGR